MIWPTRAARSWPVVIPGAPGRMTAAIALAARYSTSISWPVNTSALSASIRPAASARPTPGSRARPSASATRQARGPAGQRQRRRDLLLDVLAGTAIGAGAAGGQLGDRGQLPGRGTGGQPPLGGIRPMSSSSDRRPRPSCQARSVNIASSPPGSIRSRAPPAANPQARRRRRGG